jgi:hypothetical protein
MATKAAAASTHAIATEAATQAFLVDAAETPANAIDAVLAGVLALALRHPAVLLSSGTILLGGTGEGLLAVDARARQPGLSAPRPRGFTDASQIPDAARIAAPLLPAALTFAHAGRGVRTRTAMLNVALGVAKAATKIDEARVESLRGFGREGGGILRAGPVRDALLSAAARSAFGTLTREDLDALRGEVVNAKLVDEGARKWAIAPWSDETLATPDGELAIVAACDAHGAVAIASVLIPTMTVALPDVGLSVPMLARPILRGVTRAPAGAPLSLPSAIGVARAGEQGVDLALGVGGAGALDAQFIGVARAASETSTAIEDALARAGENRAAAVMIDSKGRARAVTHGAR